jgi:hypothetical protein
MRLLLQHTAGRLNDLCAEANRTSKDNPQPVQAGTHEYAISQAARGALAEAAIHAFGLPPFDPLTGQGALEDEALAILREFMDWAAQKKTPTGTTT